jgi:hypothetical protein
MKKFLTLIALALVPMLAFADTSGVYRLKTGTVVTNKATDKAGFHGTAGVQNPATDTAFKAAQDHGIIAAGTDYSVLHKTISLTAADIIALYATPKALIAAPGAGKSILVTKLAFTITRTATAFTGGGVVIAQYGNTVNGAGQQALDSTIAATVVTGSAGTTVSARNGNVLSDIASATIQNAALYLSNQTAAFATGTGTAVVDVWYVVQ